MAVEQFVEWFIAQIHDERVEYVSVLLGGVGFAFIVKKLTTEWTSAYRLILRFRRGLRTGGHWSTTVRLIQLMFTDRKLFGKENLTLLRRARILCEHEIFDPRPVYSWPLTPGDEKADDPLYDPAKRGSGATFADARYRADLAEWRRRMRKRMKPQGNWTILLDTPAELNEAMDAVRHYFACLQTLGLEGRESDRFICPIEVASGFATPIHLVTGLLIEFNSAWDRILQSFNTNAQQSCRYGLADFAGQDVTQIQLFSYFCWLSWGPSIPICECREWNATFSVVQFGYGDENNSIEVVGNRDEINEALAMLLERQNAQERARFNDGANPVEVQPFAGMAVPAKAIGQLRLSRSLDRHDGRDIDRLPRAALCSWAGEQGERPLLFISDIVPTNIVEEETHTQQVSRGSLTKDADASPSRYYSAYLWTAFALLEQDGQGAWMPVSEIRHGNSSWRDLFVYFEHGNLADAETCSFGKQQLARKAIAGLCEILALDPSMKRRNRFAFACAIDESGCGHKLAYPGWSGGKPMRALLGEALRERASWDPLAKEVLTNNLVRFDFFNGGDRGHPYSACNFPRLIAKHYAEMGA